MRRLLRGFVNRACQAAALYAPGAYSLRVWLHKLRGVRIGKHTFIGTAAIIETEYPELVSVGSNVTIGIRCIIIAHFRETTNERRAARLPSVIIEDEVFIGPGCIILQNVRIGAGSVVAAGSVVNGDVPPHSLVQGNPAQVIAKCKVSLTDQHSYRDFILNLVPVRRGGQ